MHKHVAELASKQEGSQQQLASAGESNGTVGATEAASVPAPAQVRACLQQVFDLDGLELTSSSQAIKV
jgi:hypothetical protein